MSTVQKLANGGTVEAFVDGLRVQKTPDGTVLKIYPDGRKIQTNKDGLRIELFSDGRKIQTNPDGVKLEIFPSGRTVQSNPDGTVIETLEDGGRTQRSPDGTFIEIRADGSRIQTQSNGTKLFISKEGRVSPYHADQHKVYRPPGVLKTEEKRSNKINNAFVYKPDSTLRASESNGKVSSSSNEKQIVRNKQAKLSVLSQDKFETVRSQLNESRKREEQLKHEVDQLKIQLTEKEAEWKAAYCNLQNEKSSLQDELETLQKKISSVHNYEKMKKSHEGGSGIAQIQRRMVVANRAKDGETESKAFGDIQAANSRLKQTMQKQQSEIQSYKELIKQLQANEERKNRSLNQSNEDKTDALAAPQDDGLARKYFNMKKAGIPQQAIRNCMIRDGMDPATEYSNSSFSGKDESLQEKIEKPELSFLEDIRKGKKLNPIASSSLPNVPRK